MSSDILWTVLLFIYYCIAQTPPPTEKPTTSPTLPFIARNCSVTFDTVSSSFDLCPLTIGDVGGQLKYYKVEDSRNVNTTTTTSASTYEYYFNVAAAIPNGGVPPICQNTSRYTHQYCPEGDVDCSGDNNTLIISDTSWAYQVRSNSDNIMESCWALSNEVGGPPDWLLIDEEDPSMGVQLIYKNGDYDDSTCKNNRRFNIRFECEDNIRFIPDEHPLYEDIPCEYTLTVPSQYGCPIECKIFDNQLCSDNGLCAYDNTNGASKCFCFNKYTGDDCSTYDKTAGIPDNSAKPKPSGSQLNGIYDFPDALNTGVEVIYDLSPFGGSNSHAAENGGVYIVHDKEYDSNPDRSWVYYVGITTRLNPTHSGSILPDYCRNIQSPCTTNDGSECTQWPDGVDPVNQTWTGSGLVFQTKNETKECFLLGVLPTGSLYDQIDDPARGITITYSQGSWCGGTAATNRQFKVNLVCPRDASAVFHPYEETKVDIAEYVEEEEPCIYSITMESAIACPYQCITNGTDAENEETFTVCSQKGVCAADPEAQFVRCLCDDGWKGVYCTEIDSPEPTESPTVSPTDELNSGTGTGFVAVIIILIIIILVIVVVGYYIYKNQKMRISQQEDEIAFHKMTDKPGIVGKDTVQTNVITDAKTGKGQFATINANDDDDDDDDDDDYN